MTNKNLTDAKLKEYFDELWRQYQWVKHIAEGDNVPESLAYHRGWAAGIDFAIMTLKSVFGLGEYAEGSEKK